MAIHLVTVVGSNIDILPHMLAYYAGLKVDSLLVNVHVEHYDDPLLPEIRSVCHRYDAEISSVFVGKWLQVVNPFLYEHTKRQKLNDWFILADVDEFQVYPEDIRSFFAKMDQNGFDCVDGCVIDRVAKDGGFPELDDTKPVWDQFPLAGLVTYTVLRANILKVAAAKGYVKTAPGQHCALNGRVSPREEAYIPVHHFKWRKGLDVRLQERIELYKRYSENIWHESQRFLDYCVKHNGKIDIADPRFYFADSTTEYPLWNEVRAKILSLARAHGL